MPRRPITPLVDLCDEVGIDHLQATELFRRIGREIDGGRDVIVQNFGTFYLRRSRARQRTLNGEVFDVPARRTNALRGQRFPSEQSVYLMGALVYRIPRFGFTDDVSGSVSGILNTDDRIELTATLRWEDFPESGEVEVDMQEPRLPPQGRVFLDLNATQLLSLNITFARVDLFGSFGELTVDVIFGETYTQELFFEFIQNDDSNISAVISLAIEQQLSRRRTTVSLTRGARLIET